MRSITKQSLTAHNTGKEFPTGNEDYNLTHKLGKVEERLFLEGVSADENDMSLKHEKITKRILINNGISIL